MVHRLSSTQRRLRLTPLLPQGPHQADTGLGGQGCEYKDCAECRAGPAIAELLVLCGAEVAVEALLTCLCAPAGRVRVRSDEGDAEMRCRRKMIQKFLHIDTHPRMHATHM